MGGIAVAASELGEEELARSYALVALQGSPSRARELHTINSLDIGLLAAQAARGPLVYLLQPVVPDLPAQLATPSVLSAIGHALVVSPDVGLASVYNHATHIVQLSVKTFDSKTRELRAELLVSENGRARTRRLSFHVSDAQDRQQLEEEAGRTVRDLLRYFD